jgi:hypothetical protein
MIGRFLREKNISSIALGGTVLNEGDRRLIGAVMLSPEEEIHCRTIKAKASGWISDALVLMALMFLCRSLDDGMTYTTCPSSDRLNYCMIIYISIVNLLSHSSQWRQEASTHLLSSFSSFKYVNEFVQYEEAGL